MGCLDTPDTQERAVRWLGSPRDSPPALATGRVDPRLARIDPGRPPTGRRAGSGSSEDPLPNAPGDGGLAEAKRRWPSRETQPCSTLGRQSRGPRRES